MTSSFKFTVCLCSVALQQKHLNHQRPKPINPLGPLEKVISTLFLLGTNDPHTSSQECTPCQGRSIKLNIIEKYIFSLTATIITSPNLGELWEQEEVTLLSASAPLHSLGFLLLSVFSACLWDLSYIPPKHVDQFAAPGWPEHEDRSREGEKPSTASA